MLKVALICLQLGVPRTLATTAFVTAFADGLASLGIDTRIVGLVQWESSWGSGWQDQWDDAPLRPFESSTPLICPQRPRSGDAAEAGRLGILDRLDDVGEDAAASPDWYLELLLERELGAFAGDDDLALVVYPISLLLMSTLARIAKRRGWRLFVQSCETLSGAWIDSATRQAYIEGVATNADGVWVLSGFLADYWQGTGVPADRILVQPNVVRQGAFLSTEPPRDCSGAYLGNLEHAEIAYLLDVVAVVSHELPQFRLSVYADATDDRRREFEAAIAAQGLDGAVVLKTPVPPSEVPQALSGVDVLLLPRARGEFSQAGFPNKLGEYLASGRPVVVTTVGDIPRYLVDGASAFLVEPDDPEAFAKALVGALADHELAVTVGRNGAKVAKALLASPVVAKRIVDFIVSLPPRSPVPVNAGQGTGLTVAQRIKVKRDDFARGLRSLRHRAGGLYRL